ncbi:MAG: SufS family cysteine desulfurase [Lachnospiraceae bacterium]|nr:SufS family cysteine desulfurase [Lachnospiraceae bacterium]
MAEQFEAEKTRTHKDITQIRADFPLLAGEYVYLDSAATSQKPQVVVEAEKEFYEIYNANPLRGLYELSVEATERYEEAREAVREFIGAKSTEEIIFTRNATESLNLVAYSYAMSRLQEGDEILVTILEHHSNFLPWLNAAKRCGAKVNFLECDRQGRITEEAFREALTGRTVLVAMTQISNVLGCENDIKTFAAIAHEQGAVFVADGAQSVPHIPVNVRELDVDFLVFSGHKMLGPMGVGVLYGKREWLDKMPPFLYGGEMIETVTRTGATYAELPHKFEAGTVNAAGAYGLAKAIAYIRELGFDAIKEREDYLTDYAFRRLRENPYVTILGSEDPAEHHGILTFKLEGVHPHDVSAILDENKVCVRAGHHCAQPLLKYLQVPSTTRASLAFYNTTEEIDRFVETLGTVRRRLGYAE